MWFPEHFGTAECCLLTVSEEAISSKTISLTCQPCQNTYLTLTGVPFFSWVVKIHTAFCFQLGSLFFSNGWLHIFFQTKISLNYLNKLPNQWRHKSEGQDRSLFIFFNGLMEMGWLKILGFFPKFCFKQKLVWLFAIFRSQNSGSLFQKDLFQFFHATFLYFIHLFLFITLIQYTEQKMTLEVI